jgi:hypothetical protein
MTSSEEATTAVPNSSNEGGCDGAPNVIVVGGNETERESMRRRGSLKLLVRCENGATTERRSMGRKEKGSIAESPNFKELCGENKP